MHILCQLFSITVASPCNILATLLGTFLAIKKTLYKVLARRVGTIVALSARLKPGMGVGIFGVPYVVDMTERAYM